MSQSTAAAPARDPDRYLVEDILPLHEVHLIGGPSGAGKSTWTFQMIANWSQGIPIHDFASYPSDWHYVACDRSLDSVKRTLERIESRIDISRITSLVDNPSSQTTGAKALLECGERVLPKGGFLVVDGIGMLTPGGKISDYSIVSDYIKALTRGCKRYKITIGGLGHATKTKEGERYLNPRQRILGSVAWGACADTVIFLDAKDEQDTENGKRELLILPRNASAVRINLMFDDRGRLIEETDDVNWVILDSWLKRFGPTSEIATHEVADFAISRGISQRTYQRWLTTRVNDGVLDRPTRGLYVRMFTT